MKQNNIWYILSLVGQLGFIIAIPLVLLALAGRYLDKVWHTSPLFLLVGMGLALIISSAVVWKMVKEIENKSNIKDQKSK